MTTGSLAILAVTSHKFFCFILFIRLRFTLQLIILQLSHIRIKADLTNIKNMVFRHESDNLDLAYLNCEPNLGPQYSFQVPRALFAVKSWGGDTSKARRAKARDARFGGSD